jgi:hypothetical protein
MILKIFSPKNSANQLAFLTQNKAKLCKILIITLFFLEKNAIFCRNMSKIAENCDHNIDPRIFKDLYNTFFDAKHHNKLQIMVQNHGKYYQQIYVDQFPKLGDPDRRRRAIGSFIKTRSSSSQVTIINIHSRLIPSPDLSASHRGQV